MRLYWTSSRGKPTRDGPPDWEVGKRWDKQLFTVKQRKARYEILHRAKDYY
jgi:hypothetical protein